MYFLQLITWLSIVVITKIFLAILQYNIHDWLEVIGSAVLYPFKDNGKLKLVVVMVIFPVVMNSIAFWVTDNFLKHKKEVYPQLELPQNNQLKYEKGDINLENLEEDKGKESMNHIDSIVRGKNNDEIRIDFGNNEDDKNNQPQSKENIKEYINLKIMNNTNLIKDNKDN